MLLWTPRLLAGLPLEQPDKVRQVRSQAFHPAAGLSDQHVAVGQALGCLQDGVEMGQAKTMGSLLVGTAEIMVSESGGAELNESAFRFRSSHARRAGLRRCPQMPLSPAPPAGLAPRVELPYGVERLLREGFQQLTDPMMRSVLLLRLPELPPVRDAESPRFEELLATLAVRRPLPKKNREPAIVSLCGQSAHGTASRLEGGGKPVLPEAQFAVGVPACHSRSAGIMPQVQPLCRKCCAVRRRLTSLLAATMIGGGKSNSDEARRGGKRLMASASAGVILFVNWPGDTTNRVKREPSLS
jgi:hypothetical protein